MPVGLGEVPVEEVMQRVLGGGVEELREAGVAVPCRRSHSLAVVVAVAGPVVPWPRCDGRCETKRDQEAHEQERQHAPS